ncbi:MAG: ABC transporter substrate-binding protein, partial [Planctomycetota bacterium]
KELEERGTLYRLDEDAVRAIEPNVIFTQALCDVCAVDYATVKDFAATLPGPPDVVNLDPHSLAQIMGDIRRVAMALGEPGRAETVIGALELRLEDVRRKVRRAAERPRCVLMEWIDPVYCSGHWGPEIVELAGGQDPLGRKGEDSVGVEWERVIEAQPEVLVLACCGYRADRTLEDVSILESRPGWDDLPAVQEGRVWAVDANAYFSRPGPRIVDSVEILASLIHPEIFGEEPGHGVIRAV